MHAYIASRTIYIYIFRYYAYICLQTKKAEAVKPNIDIIPKLGWQSKH